MMKGLIIQQQHQEQQQQQVGVDQENMSNLTCTSTGDQASASSDNIPDGTTFPQHYFPSSHHDQPVQSQPPLKKKRNLPGNPDPEAEVIALSPTTLMATNRFVCEVCGKGFQRDQNLQLHRRGHNLPWKLKQRTSKEVKKKVYICPQVGCVHHEPSRALGDLTGIKKHFCRKHGDKKFKCDKCSKRYAVQSDWKAHSKTCGTREYRCDCGTLFSRRDSFITHRAFCDALAEESARAVTGLNPLLLPSQPSHNQHVNGNLYQIQQVPHQFNTIDLNQFSFNIKDQNFPPWLTYPSENGSSPDPGPQSGSKSSHQAPIFIKKSFDDQEDYTQHDQQNPNPSGVAMGPTILPPYHLTTTAAAHMSATALLQKAAQMGATINTSSSTSDCTSSSMTTTMIPNGQGHVPANSVTTSTTTTTTTGFGLYLSSRDQLHLQGGPSSYFQPNHHHHILMMNALSSGISNNNHNDGDDHESTAYEDAMVNGFLDAKKEEVVVGDQMIRGNVGNFGSQKNRVGSEGMTRDFLGLKPLSHTDIMTMAGLTSSIGQQQSQTPRSW